jgi:hypothetical protein
LTGECPRIGIVDAELLNLIEFASARDEGWD